MHRKNNRGQGVLRGRKLEEAKWCRCSKRKKKKGVAVCSRERKVQQGSMQTEAPKGAGILWSGKCARRCTAVGVRMDDRRSHSDLHRM